MDSFFQRSLNDVLKTLRLQYGSGGSRSSSSSRAAMDAFMSQVYKDALRECKSSDPQTKSTALLKLLYLHMAQGSDLQPAAFHCVEAMSSARFSAKEIGYLVGSECLQEKPDMLLLATHLLRKDLGSPNQHEASFALSCLSCVCSADLAMNIGADVLSLLQSSRAMVRRKATLALLRMVQRSPETLKAAFKPLLERLEDSNQAVVTAAVCVFAELALHDPASFLPLAPNLVPLLTPTTSPWVAIKLVKIVGAMAQVEPRLIRKVQEPMAGIMNATSSKSLLLECVRVVLHSMPQNGELRVLALQKAAELLDTGDANLRYLGLQALLSTLPEHATEVATHKASIISCFDHPDASIQNYTLRLVSALVAEASLVPTVSVLRSRLPSADLVLSNQIEATVLGMCSFDAYSRITDFDWYLDVLLDLCYLPSSRQGLEIGRQVVDLAVRVPGLRGNLVKAAKRLVMDTPVLAPRSSASFLLASAAEVLGETGVSTTGSVLDREGVLATLDALLQPGVLSLSAALQAVYVQAAMKLALKVASQDGSESVVEKALHLLRPFQGSSHMEVQERAWNAAAVLSAAAAGEEDAQKLATCLSEGILRLPDGKSETKTGGTLVGPAGEAWGVAQSRKALMKILSQGCGAHGDAAENGLLGVEHLFASGESAWVCDRVSFTDSSWQRSAVISNLSITSSQNGVQGDGVLRATSSSARPDPAQPDPRSSPFYLPSEKQRRTGNPEAGIAGDGGGSKQSITAASGTSTEDQSRRPAPMLLGLLDEGSAPSSRTHEVVKS